MTILDPTAFEIIGMFASYLLGYYLMAGFLNWFSEKDDWMYSSRLFLFWWVLTVIFVIVFICWIIWKPFDLIIRVRHLEEEVKKLKRKKRRKKKNG